MNFKRNLLKFKISTLLQKHKLIKHFNIKLKHNKMLIGNKKYVKDGNGLMKN